MSIERAEDMQKNPSENADSNLNSEETTEPKPSVTAEKHAETNSTTGQEASQETDDMAASGSDGTGEIPEVNTNETKIRLVGILVLLITFGGFGSWAFIAPLDSAALAQGVVTVKNYRKTIQHLEGGIVKDILVRDGDFVKQDQVLIVLDSAQSRAEQGILLGRLAVAEATEARLLAERDGLDAIDFKNNALSDDPKIQDVVSNEKAVFEARTNSRAGEISVLEKRISQLRASIKGVEALIASQKTLSASYEEEMGELQELLAQGFVDKQRLRELQRSKARLDGEVAEQEASIAATEVQIGETQLRILQLKKEFQEETADQLKQVRAELTDLRERLSAINDRLARTEITAPVSGRVIGLSVHTVGGVIQSGTPLGDIVPDDEQLIVEAQVSPIDIDRVQPGMIADVRFSAFKSATTPVMEGKVIDISPDRLVDQSNGMPYYLARVELTEEGQKLLGNLTLVPGMPAEVLINTGSRTLFEYLAQPATNAFARSFLED